MVVAPLLSGWWDVVKGGEAIARAQVVGAAARGPARSRWGRPDAWASGSRHCPKSQTNKSRDRHAIDCGALTLCGSLLYGRHAVHHRHHHMCVPPSTSSTCPVTNAAHSLARNRIAPAASRAEPMRRSGVMTAAISRIEAAPGMPSFTSRPPTQIVSPPSCGCVLCVLVGVEWGGG